MEVILHRALILSLILIGTLHADNGADAWLRYPGNQSQPFRTVATIGDSVLTISARDELKRDLPGLRTASGIPKENAIVMGTLDKLPPEWGLNANLVAASYWLKTVE